MIDIANTSLLAALSDAATVATVGLCLVALSLIGTWLWMK